MGLEELHIPGTKLTPDINLKPNGVLKIKGRGFKIFNNQTSQEIFSWLVFYIEEPSEVTSVMLAFEI